MSLSCRAKLISDRARAEGSRSDKRILQSNIPFQMFLFNNIMFCIQSVWKRSNLTLQREEEGAVG